MYGHKEEKVCADKLLQTMFKAYCLDEKTKKQKCSCLNEEGDIFPGRLEEGGIMSGIK